MTGLWVTTWPLAGIFMALGAFLALRSVRRTGDTPFCRRCGYNLTGLDLSTAATRCPECGSYLHPPNAVRRGQRNVARRSLTLGVVLFVLATAGLGWGVWQHLKQVRWYEHYPLSWVIHDYQSTTLITTLRARSEIDARLRAGTLSNKQVARVIELFLAEQARPELRLNPGGGAIRSLGELWRAGRLNPDQERRFLEFSNHFSARVRCPGVVGKPCTAVLHWQPRLAQGLREQVSVLQLAPGREPQHVFGMEVQGVTNEMNLNLPFVGLPPGRTVLKLIVEVVLYDQKDPDTPLLREKKEFPLETDILPAEPADYIRLRSGPELDAAVRQCVGPVNMSVRTIGNERVLFAGASCRPPFPLGLAFDVIVQFGGKDHPAGTLLISPGDPGGDKGVAAFTLEEPTPDRATLVLQGSQQAALCTADLFEIWGGELRFENVPVRPK